MIERKEPNPKDATGSGKVGLSVLPLPALLEAAVGATEGARKYGRHNWREEGARASTFFDAAIRHLFAWWEGEDLDPASGVNHVSKAVADLLILRDSIMRGQAVDDRPPSSATFIPNLNRQTKAIVEDIPDPRPPHVQIAPDEDEMQFQF